MTEIRDRLKPVISHVHNDAGDLDYHSRLGWFGVVLTDIALALGEDEIVHVDSKWSGRPTEGLTVEFLVLTADSVISATITTTVDGEGPVHAATVSRRDALERLTITGGTSLTANDIGQSWPGWITVTLGWKDGSETKLPLTRTSASQFELEIGRAHV